MVHPVWLLLTKISVCKTKAWVVVCSWYQANLNQERCVSSTFHSVKKSSFFTISIMAHFTRSGRYKLQIWKFLLLTGKVKMDDYRHLTFKFPSKTLSSKSPLSRKGTGCKIHFVLSFETFRDKKTCNEYFILDMFQTIYLPNRKCIDV